MVTGHGVDLKDHWSWPCKWCPQAHPEDYRMQRYLCKMSMAFNTYSQTNKWFLKCLQLEAEQHDLHKWMSTEQLGIRLLFLPRDVSDMPLLGSSYVLPSHRQRHNANACRWPKAAITSSSKRNSKTAVVLSQQWKFPVCVIFWFIGTGHCLQFFDTDTLTLQLGVRKSIQSVTNQKAPQGGCGHRRQHARFR